METTTALSTMSNSNLTLVQRAFVALDNLKSTAISKEEAECILCSQETPENKRFCEISAQGRMSYLVDFLDMLLVMTQFKNLFGTEETEIQKNKKLFIEVLLENMNKEHGIMRVHEIREAIRRGGNKKYDFNGFFTISPTEIIRWLTCYRTDKNRALYVANNLYEKLQDALPKGQEEDSREVCKKLYNHRKTCMETYLAYGRDNLLAGSAYDFLANHKFIEISDEDKKAELDIQLMNVYRKVKDNFFLNGISKECRDFISDIDKNTELPPRQRMSNKENSNYLLAITLSKRAIFQRELMALSPEQWLEKFNNFLQLNHYKPL